MPRNTRSRTRQQAQIEVVADDFTDYPNVPVRPVRQVCPYGCGRVVAPRTVELHRNQGCRGYQEEPFGEDRRRNYICGVCCMEFHTRRGFMDHLHDEHDVAARVHVLDFPNKHMFERFMRWLEAQGGANFRTRSGAKKQLSGKKSIIFMCNRTGYVESVGKRNKEDKDKMGPVRCGYTCTAYVQCIEHLEGHVTATFCGDHYGHDARMRVPLAVRHLVARLFLINSLSYQDIIRYLHFHFEPLCSENVLAQRICMIDTDEIRIMIQSTKKFLEQDPDFPTRLDIWDEELFDKAGVVTPWLSQRNLGPGDKTIDEIAREQDWPVPSMFVAKQKNAEGHFRPVIHMLNGVTEKERAAREREITAMEEVVEHVERDHEHVEGDDGASGMNTSGAKEMESQEMYTDHHDPYTMSSVLVPSRRRPHRTSTSHIDVDDSVGYETINVEDLEEHDESHMRMISGADGQHKRDRAKIPKPMSTTRSYLIRSVLSEASLIKTLVQGNALFQSDEDLSSWLCRLRNMRDEFNALSKRSEMQGGTSLQQHNPEATYFDSLTDDLDMGGMGAPSIGVKRLSSGDRIEVPYRRHAPSSLVMLKTSLLEDTNLSDDEQMVESGSGGAIAFRSELWS